MNTDLGTNGFIDLSTAQAIREEFGTPVYVYDLKLLEAKASEVSCFPNAFGLTPRFAMKACPNRAILQVFRRAGLLIDASSGYEVRRALAAGFAAGAISLSSQELPDDFAALVELGIEFNACSLGQLTRFGEAFPGASVGLRFNPGAGSGGNNRTNVGGPSSSFGIWHGDIDRVREIVERYRLNAVRIHTHIGSGSDPAVWQKVSGMSLDIVRQFPGVATLNLGGGYKVARVEGEQGTDLKACGTPVAEKFREFAAETGREIHLEIEPGTYLVANAGALLTTVRDIVSTGDDGYAFIKLDSGMTEVLRPSLYGSQHRITLLQAEVAETFRDYVVVGHCCESGDILTPADGDPEMLAPRKMPLASLGDLCVVEGCGAYCAAMSAKHYNSYPEAAEVLLDRNGTPHLIRRRQQPEQIWINELDLPTGV